ncbi:MAG: PEP-CTERM sorting domain-containing protein [Planctomycetes bacterium]|nr:PEP-CTERM sorting domain-containing protein [Planctomycetota bacterium]
MSKRIVDIVFAAVLVAFSGAAQATVVEIRCNFWTYGDSTYTWSFDYDLQHLTITETISQLDFSGYIALWGLVDTDSTFTVIRTITNNTGITWTGYGLYWRPTITPGYADIVRDSITSTHLQAITFPDRWTVDFSGSPLVLNGESFTINFDAVTRDTIHAQGQFFTTSQQNFIPEPGTISLLGLGGLLLLRKRKAERNTAHIC